MDNEIVKSVLTKMGAVLTDDHFVYASGKHGGSYVAKDVLYTDPHQTSVVCGELALQIFDHCRHDLKINKVTIVSPVVGGVALSQWVTYHLLNFVWSGKPTGFSASAAFADKEQTAFTLSEGELIKIGGHWDNIPKGATLLVDTGTFVIKRGYGKLVSGQNVVVVEDVLTTGNSAKATIEAVKKAGGNVVMTAAICNRGGVTALMLGTPYLYSALNVDFETFDPGDCLLCKERHVPINTEFGHGKAFLEKAGKSDVVTT